MTDNGIGACADDPLALGDLDGARCIAVLLEHPQDQNIAEKYSSVCKEYQVDRDGIQSMKAQVNGNGYKSSDDDQRDCINDRNLLFFSFLQIHPPLQHLRLMLQKIAYCNQHRQDENRPIKPPLPVTKGAGQKIDNDGNDNCGQTKPYHCLPSQPFVSLPVNSIIIMGYAVFLLNPLTSWTGMKAKLMPYL